VAQSSGEARAKWRGCKNKGENIFIIPKNSTNNIYYDDAGKIHRLQFFNTLDDATCLKEQIKICVSTSFSKKKRINEKIQYITFNLHYQIYEVSCP
jgi:hypothetical protein